MVAIPPFRQSYRNYTVGYIIEPLKCNGRALQVPEYLEAGPDISSGHVRRCHPDRLL